MASVFIKIESLHGERGTRRSTLINPAQIISVESVDDDAWRSGRAPMDSRSEILMMGDERYFTAIPVEQFADVFNLVILNPV